MHSQVFECIRRTEEESDIPLAVKVTREDDPEKKLLIAEEFKITRQLDHPHIVKSIDYFENNFSGEIFQVMN